MTTYTWPDAIRPASVALQLEANVREFASPYTGSVDAVDLMGERWRVSMALPPRFRSQGGALEALFNKLRGVHKLSLPYYARPVPGGTLRGSPLLNASVVQGATSIVLKDVRTAINLLLMPRAFDLSPWGAVNSGTATANTATAPDGTVTADTLTDANASSSAGRRQTVTIAADSSSYVASVYLLKTSGGTSKTVQFQTSMQGGSVITRNVRVNTDTGTLLTGSGSVTDVDASWWRVIMDPVSNDGTNTSMQFTIFPAVDAYGGTGSVGATTGSCTAWGAQLEIGSAATAYAPPTLLAGDMLGLGGQWLQVADDVTASADGTMTVTLANRVRAAASSGAAVTWDRPQATFRLAGPVAVTHLSAMTDGLELELVEAW